ncbi:hypothetical protein FA13DRAFT_1741243, partial [Coprinellus micaceus]
FGDAPQRPEAPRSCQVRTWKTSVSYTCHRPLYECEGRSQSLLNVRKASNSASNSETSSMKARSVSSGSLKRSHPPSATSSKEKGGTKNKGGMGTLNDRFSVGKGSVDGKSLSNVNESGLRK